MNLGENTQKREEVWAVLQGREMICWFVVVVFFMAVVDDKANEIYQSHPFTDKQHHSFQ